MTPKEEQRLEEIRKLIPNLPKESDPLTILNRVYEMIQQALSAEDRYQKQERERTRQWVCREEERKAANETKNLEWRARLLATRALAEKNIIALETLRTQLWMIVGLDLLESEEESDDLLIQKVRELKVSDHPRRSDRGK